jgi:hypothetical protein
LGSQRREEGKIGKMKKGREEGVAVGFERNRTEMTKEERRKKMNKKIKVGKRKNNKRIKNSI